MFNNPIISQIISIAVAAACGWLASQISHLRKRDAALYEGMKAVLRKELVDDFERYVANSEPLSIERKQEIDDCFAAYSALGGNGTGRQMYERICEAHVELLTQQGRKH